MPNQTTTKVAGLWRQPNDIASVPEGALNVADDVVLSRDDVLECRRGLSVVSTQQFARQYPFKGEILGWKGDGSLSHSADDGATWSETASGVTAPIGYPIRTVEAAENLYLTSGLGLRRLESPAAAPVAAGVPPGLDCSCALASSGAGSTGFLPFQGQVAYRAVWGTRDAHGTLILGAPGGREVFVNPSPSTTDSYDVAVTVTVPQALSSRHFLQLYRTKTFANTAPDEEMSQVVERAFPPTISAATYSLSSTFVTVTTATPHGLLVGDYVEFSPPPGYTRSYSWVSTVTSPTVLTYRDYVAPDAPPAPAGGIRVIALRVVDDATDDVRQAALYTNPSQQGMSQAPSRDASWCADAVWFRNCLILANQTATQASAVFNIAATGGERGIQDNAVVYVDGHALTAHIEEVPTAAFTLYGDGLSAGRDLGTPSLNIAATASSFVRVVNRVLGPLGYYALYLSGDADFPGRVGIFSYGAAASITIATDGSLPVPLSAAQAFIPPIPSLADGGYVFASTPKKNRIYWSKSREPESVPALNFADVGSADRAVERIVSTRDSVFILKDGDGVFRLTGTSPADFRIDPFDPNTHIVAPETAYALDNKVFILTEQGAAAVTDTGVELISRAIETDFQPLVAGTMKSMTRQLAFSVGVESDRKYLLWLPTQASDTLCTQAYVYDLVTQGWTRWTRPARHAITNPSDDRIYLLDADGVRRERKNFDVSDFADESYPLTITANTSLVALKVADVANVRVGDVIAQGSGWAIVTSIVPDPPTQPPSPPPHPVTIWLDRPVSWELGAATLYRAISVVVEPVPRFAPPGYFHNFREVSLAFREAYAAQVQFDFSTDVDQRTESVTLNTYWQAVVHDHPVMRVAIPRNKSRGSMIRVAFRQTQAWCPVGLQAFSVEYSPGTAPVTWPRRAAALPATSTFPRSLGSRLGG